ncbi:hypothetical protein RIF29_37091 [Crotalaria pallida]|uniref:Uncharacterized protein n=1 Tax=Crotalaria pallida TaxID=3830 RepID=A0AAN9HYY6_CROPI
MYEVSWIDFMGLGQQTKFCVLPSSSLFPVPPLSIQQPDPTCDDRPLVKFLSSPLPRGVLQLKNKTNQATKNPMQTLE